MLSSKFAFILLAFTPKFNPDTWSEMCSGALPAVESFLYSWILKINTFIIYIYIFICISAEFFKEALQMWQNLSLKSHWSGVLDYV